MKSILSFFMVLLSSLSVMAQGDMPTGDIMRSQLKIYVVVAVLLIIFSGIIVFLFAMERRVKALEEKV